MEASSRGPTSIPGSIHAVPSKTGRCFQPLETSAQRTLLSIMLVIGTQICSGAQEVTPVYYKLVWINAVLSTPNSPDHPKTSGNLTLALYPVLV